MSDPARGKQAYEEGKDYTNQKAYDQAKAKFTEAIKADPQEAYYFARGYVYLLTEDPERAWSDFEQALNWDRKSVGALTGLGFISKQRGNYPAAISFYTQAAEIAPKAADIYRRRAQIYLDAGMDDKYEVEKAIFGWLLLSEENSSHEYFII